MNNKNKQCKKFQSLSKIIYQFKVRMKIIHLIIINKNVLPSEVRRAIWSMLRFSYGGAEGGSGEGEGETTPPPRRGWL